MFPDQSRCDSWLCIVVVVVDCFYPCGWYWWSCHTSKYRAMSCLRVKSKILFDSCIAFLEYVYSYDMQHSLFISLVAMGCATGVARSINHMPVSQSLFPWKDLVGSNRCSKISVFEVNVAWYSLSKFFAIDNNAFFYISGNTWHCRAAMDMFVISGSVVCVASIVMLLGNSTLTPA